MPFGRRHALELRTRERVSKRRPSPPRSIRSASDGRASRALLVALAAAATLLGTALFFLYGGDLGAPVVKPLDAPPTSSSLDATRSTAPVPPSPPETSDFDASPESLVAALEALGAAIVARDPIEAEAQRYGLRQRFLEKRPPVRQLLAATRSEVARREIIPLVLDVEGGVPLAELESWLVGQSHGVRALALLRLARLGRSASRTLESLLATVDDERLGADAMLWLLRRPAISSADIASSMPRVDEAVVARAIAGLLATPEDEELKTLLRGALKESLPFRVREAVVDALATTYPDAERAKPSSPDELFRRASDADIVKKTLVLRSAGDFMDDFKRNASAPEAIEAVRDFVRTAALRDPDPLVRRAAILSRIGLSANLGDLAGQCRALLEVAAVDPDPGVRAAVLRRVHRGSAHTRMPFGPAYLEPYLRNESDPEVRREALRTLPRWLGAGNDEAQARALLAEALERDPHPGVRLEAAALLTELGYEQARPHLEAAGLHDADPGFRDALFEAVRTQLANEDAELFERLRAADPKRAELRPLQEDEAQRARSARGALPARGRGSASAPSPGRAGLVLSVPTAGAAGSGHRPLEDPLGVVDGAGSEASPVSGASLPGVPHRFPPGTSSPGLRRRRFMIPGLPAEPSLGAWLVAPPARAARLVVLVPRDPLLGGCVPFAGEEFGERLVKERGVAVLGFDFRGRGRSEGYAGRGLGEGRDLEAVLAFAATAVRGGPESDGADLVGAPVVVGIPEIGEVVVAPCAEAPDPARFGGTASPLSRPFDREATDWIPGPPRRAVDAITRARRPLDAEAVFTELAAALAPFGR